MPKKVTVSPESRHLTGPVRRTIRCSIVGCRPDRTVRRLGLYLPDTAPETRIN
jgi:hypothetical protein